jgi:hypothetical protein
MGLTNWLKPTDHGHWEMNTETGIARRTHPSLPRSRLAGEGRVGVSTELETCAACHSRRRVIAKNPTPGAPFLDSYLPALLEAGLYHADGQIDGEVYEYGSFLQSRMSHAKGHLLRLPRPAQHAAARQRQCAVRPMPHAREIRRGRAPSPPAGQHRGAVRQLPHAEPRGNWPEPTC